MKTLITILLITINFYVNAQDYENIFAELEKHSSTGFKDILGDRRYDIKDDTMAFYQVKSNLKLGSAHIGVVPSAGSVLTWKIPLNQSKDIIASFENYIQNKYGKDEFYTIETQGKKTEGFEMKMVIDITLIEDPLMVMESIYSIDEKNPAGNFYIIQIFGK